MIKRKKRTWFQRTKIADNIAFAIVMSGIIGLYWWIDSIEIETPKLEQWRQWLDDQFFLLEFGAIMLYLLIVVIFFNLIHKGLKLLIREIMGL